MKKISLKNTTYLIAMLAIASCSTESITNNQVEQKYNNIDRYDNISSNKAIDDDKIQYIKDKWYSGKVRESRETFKGHSFKIDTKTHIGELKEFRVRWVSNNNKSYPSSIENMITEVSQRYMIRTCGKGMPITVYTNPSLGLKRQDITKWEVQYGGSEIKEYGFRCLFN